MDVDSLTELIRHHNTKRYAPLHQVVLDEILQRIETLKLPKAERFDILYEIWDMVEFKKIILRDQPYLKALFSALYLYADTFKQWVQLYLDKSMSKIEGRKLKHYTERNDYLIASKLVHLYTTDEAELCMTRHYINEMKKRATSDMISKFDILLDRCDQAEAHMRTTVQRENDTIVFHPRFVVNTSGVVNTKQKVTNKKDSILGEEFRPFFKRK